MVSRDKVAQDVINNNRTSEVFLESLKVGFFLRRKSDGKWYEIKEIQNNTNNNEGHKTQLQFLFYGFLVWRRHLHKHFDTTIDRKFIIKG